MRSVSFLHVLFQGYKKICSKTAAILTHQPCSWEETTVVLKGNCTRHKYDRTELGEAHHTLT